MAKDKPKFVYPKRKLEVTVDGVAYKWSPKAPDTIDFGYGSFGGITPDHFILRFMIRIDELEASK